MLFLLLELWLGLRASKTEKREIEGSNINMVWPDSACLQWKALER